MSEEIQLDVADAFAAARKEIEAKINKRIANVDYGESVQKLYFIAIVRKIVTAHEN